MIICRLNLIEYILVPMAEDTGELTSPDEKSNKEWLPQPEAIDYRKILGDSNVLFVSDDHTSFTDKDAFKQALDALVKVGVTDLGLEMLPRGFNTEDVEAAKTHFQSRWEKAPGMPAKYLEVLTHAKRLGLNVWGLEISSDEYRRHSQDETFEKRNKQWADIIDGELHRFPEKKAVIYCGSAHTGYSPFGRGVNQILEGWNYKPVVVKYWGDDHDIALNTEARTIQQYIENNKPEDAFMVPVPMPMRTADYFIYTGKSQKQPPANT
jgi:hypothetical protein